jgi:hypothetical protein
MRSPWSGTPPAGRRGYRPRRPAVWTSAPLHLSPCTRQ